MVSPRRVERLCSLIKQRVAEVLMQEAKDPRLGFITITRVELDRELERCRVYWSVFGGDGERRTNERALEHGRKFVQHAVAEILPTAKVPQISFEFDESIAGSIRLESLIKEVRAQDDAAAREREPDEDASAANSDDQSSSRKDGSDEPVSE